MNEKTALLRATQENNAAFEWPAELLPPDTKMGDTFFLELKTPTESKSEQLKQMRRMLEELVG